MVDPLFGTVTANHVWWWWRWVGKQACAEVSVVEDVADTEVL